jgi:hypothetical protein
VCLSSVFVIRPSTMGVPASYRQEINCSPRSDHADGCSGYARAPRRRHGTGIEVFDTDMGSAACLRGRPASWQRANDLVMLPLETLPCMSCKRLNLNGEANRLVWLLKCLS